jgi:hypothetical protein
MKSCLNLVLILTLILASDLLAKDINIENQNNIPREMFKINKLPDVVNSVSSVKSITGYNVGDEKKFWKYDLTVMPPKWVEDPAICLAAGNHSYVFVSTEQWYKTFSETDADSILKYLEEKTFASNDKGIIQTVVECFGDIPDAIDNDPKVIFYYSALGSYKGKVFNGYFSSFNQITDAEAQSIDGSHSNECEMLLMSCSPVKPIEKLNLSVLAHELQHLIHFAKDWDEEQWVNEGCSEYAMLLCGLPDPILEFQDAPNISLLNWNKQYSDQIKVLLFFTYLAEHYGGNEFIKQLVANEANGLDGIKATLEAMNHNISIPELISNWTIANFIDDMEISNGLYGYNALKIPAFKVEQKFTSFPINKSSYMDGCSAQYYDLPTNFVNLNLEFEFPAESNWNTALIAYENNKPKEVIHSVNGKFELPNPKDYNLSRLVLVVTSTDPDVNTRDYTIKANNVTDVEEYTNLSRNELAVFPNPAISAATINYDINKSTYVSLKLYDYFGREIAVLDNGIRTPGRYSVNLDASGLPNGTYLIRLNVGDFSLTKDIIIYR